MEANKVEVMPEERTESRPLTPEERSFIQPLALRRQKALEQVEHHRRMAEAAEQEVRTAETGISVVLQALGADGTLDVQSMTFYPDAAVEGEAEGGGG